MSKVQVDNIVNKADNGPPTFTKGVNVVGVVSATSFVGSGSSLTGINVNNKAIAMTIVFGT